MYFSAMLATSGHEQQSGNWGKERRKQEPKGYKGTVPILEFKKKGFSFFRKLHYTPV
jgi:hypothetical protein